MKPRLKVSTAGRRHYIDVPAGHAAALHRYLRGNWVQAAPPEPASTGFDTLELPARIDAAAVQKLLDDWK
jgi:hypothetical protein